MVENDTRLHREGEEGEEGAGRRKTSEEELWLWRVRLRSCYGRTAAAGEREKKRGETASVTVVLDVNNQINFSEQQ